jgi:ubiquinone biosynthesis monooxygenase Coq7
MTLSDTRPPDRVIAFVSATPLLLGDLRSDHAGETGAVMIYRGILAGTVDPALRRFALDHLATEQEHLALVETLLVPSLRSRLLPIWRVAGWMTGFLPAMLGPRAVYATIEAVEIFVDHHYAAQIARLPETGSGGVLRSLLVMCRADEVLHRDEARAALDRPVGGLLAAWTRLVGWGSAVAVAVARRV